MFSSISFRYFLLLKKGKIIILIISIMSVSTLWSQESSNTKVHKVNPEAFDFFMQAYDNAVVIDVQLWQDYRKKRICNAYFGGEEDELRTLLSVLGKDQPILVYSMYGVRCYTPLKIVSSMGFVNIYQLENGLNAWENSGFPVEKKRVRWRKRRKYEY